MKGYSKIISGATGVTVESDLVEIEDYMRYTIFNSTLDWQTTHQLSQAAKTAWSDIQFMRSPEGQKYLQSLTIHVSGV